MLLLTLSPLCLLFSFLQCPQGLALSPSDTQAREELRWREREREFTLLWGIEERGRAVVIGLDSTGPEQKALSLLSFREDATEARNWGSGSSTISGLNSPMGRREGGRRQR